ncbi:putative tail tapemeasure protein [uncultured Caudovirales phage]|uniref:Putative tail tapemeasure protein n=1 Tax=uncultured Caudovirales phage TaxID=2100421 RepID=A0A2H4J055_9CAUD|nr:putative tail tapemeasure protein [uncultured Caudovirales phage]
MANKEIYKLDIKINVDGDQEAKKKLTATERFAQQAEKRTKALDKIKASPSVRLKDKLSKPLQKIEGKLSSFSKSACSKLAAIATAGAVMIGGLGISAAVRDFSNFEQGLANVKAISGATAEEMQLLGNEAKRLGAATAWSAKEVTDAETLLSQAGFKVEETIAALPGLLDMASAGGIDLAQATDIAAGTLRAFGLAAQESSHVADVLAVTASRTNSDITGLGESLKYVAPVSKALGVSLEDTSAALGMLADANIKGSQSGTVLRAAFSRLANPPKKAADMIKKLGFSVFDAQGKMLPLGDVIGNLQKSMNGLTEQQKAQAVSTIFGIESMSGMLALVEQGPEKLKRLSNELENSNGAAKKMAETRLDSLQGQFTILKSAVEGMNIELGEKLAPYAKEFVTWFTAKIPDITNKIMEVTDKVFELAHKFKELNPATKKFIGYLATGIVFFAPLSKGIIGVTKGLTGLVGIGGKLGRFLGIFKGASVVTEATAAIATGTEAAAGGVAGLGLAAKGGALLLNPWTIGIAAAGAGAYKLYKHLSKDALPAIKEFGEGLSKSTAEGMNAYRELDVELGASLMNIKIKSEKITEETATAITGKFAEMGNMIHETISQKYSDSYKVMEEFFAMSGAFTDEKSNEILNRINEKQAFEEGILQQGLNRINEIYRNAAAEHREITSQEQSEVNNIRQNMMNQMVENISQSSDEQLMIQGRLKNESTVMNAQQAADIVKESAKARDAAILDAETQANEVIESARYQRDVLGTLKPEEAQTIISAAECQKEYAVNAAQGMHEEVVMHAQKQAKEHVNEVNWQTGEVLSNFDSMIAKIKEFNALPIREKVVVIKQKISAALEGFNDSVAEQNEKRKQLGQTYVDAGLPIPAELKGGKATGGRTVKGAYEVAERGFEIVVGRQTRMFNGGEKVLNHRESRKFLHERQEKRQENTKEEAPQMQFAVAQPQLATGGGINVNIDGINVENSFDSNIDKDGIIKETLRQVEYHLKEALRNTK